MQRIGAPADPAQIDALVQFQLLFDQFAAKERTFGSGLIKRLVGKKSIQPRGIYIWGGVGRGKTYLMDLFFDAVPVSSGRVLDVVTITTPVSYTHLTLPTIPLV